MLALEKFKFLPGSFLTVFLFVFIFQDRVSVWTHTVDETGLKPGDPPASAY